jgi:hypothetical protein
MKQAQLLNWQRKVAGRELGEVPNTFEIGEKVWLDGRNLRLKMSSPKLTDRCLGPFEVTEKLSERAYHLKLPENLKIHDVFYVGLLSKVNEDPARPIVQEPGPLEVEGEEEYEVEEIVDSERHRDGWYYRVKWKGYGPETNTWELKANLEHAENILKKYHQKLLKKACDTTKSLKGGGSIVNSTKTLKLFPIFLNFFRSIYALISHHVTPALILAKLPF